MFRAVRPLFARVPYATLFGHNMVLQRVFEAPADKVAMRVELPGAPVTEFTYGRLQRDVVELADTLVARREAVAAATGGASLDWLQAPRAANVRSVFAQGERTPSCDVLKDTGFYTNAVMCGPGYAYAVALLGSWAVNQLATPMSVAQRYNDELMYVLEHSGARSIIGETKLLKEKFPAEYEPLYVRSAKEIGLVKKAGTKRSGSSSLVDHTFLVDTVYDWNSLASERELTRVRQEEKEATLTVEEIGVEGEKESMNTADDLVKRIDKEKAALRQKEKEHLEALLFENHKLQNDYMDDSMRKGSAPLCFDTDKPSELNAVFRHWLEHPNQRPTMYDDCMMVYTSGTTARPKGAVHTHASVANMVRVLQNAWEWKETDSILHVLPVHHVHGLVNVLLCSLASHARCVTTKFDDPARIAHRLEQGDISLFMAVPTIYTKLIDSVKRHFSPIEKTGFRKLCSENIRLMVCGSAALPVPTLEQFRELSGHTLLERYGMTEIGIALSQPLRPVKDRIPGTVGAPLPTVQAFVYKAKNAEESEELSAEQKAKEERFDEVGALAIASESLFDRYWNNPTATKKELRVNEQGVRFFDTGDTVGVMRKAGKPPVFTILGRSSVDIIKSRGYKLSALEIEAALLSRKDLFYEMAVVGSKDEVKGEAVVAIVALQPDAAKARGVTYDPATKSCESEALSSEMKEVALKVLAPYQCPSRYIFVPEIPRNPTGKVNKKELKKALHLP